MPKTPIDKNRPLTSRSFSYELIVFGFLPLASLAYGIYSRTFRDYLTYSIAVGLPIAFGIYVVLLISIAGGRRSPMTFTGINLAVSGPLAFSLFMGACYYSVGIVIKDSYFWLDAATLPPNLRPFVAGLVTLLIGGALFMFRLRWRVLYGLTEAIVGMLVAANRVNSTSEGIGSLGVGIYLALLTAGAYLVVRGLDNIHSGFTKEPYDPLVRKLFMRTLRRSEATPSADMIAARQDKFGLADIFLGSQSARRRSE